MAAAGVTRPSQRRDGCADRPLDSHGRVLLAMVRQRYPQPGRTADTGSTPKAVPAQPDKGGCEVSRSARAVLRTARRSGGRHSCEIDPPQDAESCEVIPTFDHFRNRSNASRSVADQRLSRGSASPAPSQSPRVRKPPRRDIVRESALGDRRLSSRWRSRYVNRRARPAPARHCRRSSSGRGAGTSDGVSGTRNKRSKQIWPPWRAPAPGLAAEGRMGACRCYQRRAMSMTRRCPKNWVADGNMKARDGAAGPGPRWPGCWCHGHRAVPAQAIWRRVRETR